MVLFPEASVISVKKFVPSDELQQALGPDPLVEPAPFDEGERLAFVANSLRYHRITAIETKADEHGRINDLFMSDLVRKRLGMSVE